MKCLGDKMDEENLVLIERLRILESQVCSARVAYMMELCSYSTMREAIHDFNVNYLKTKQLLDWR
jgi:hypothetical protein